VSVKLSFGPDLLPPRSFPTPQTVANPIACAAHERTSPSQNLDAAASALRAIIRTDCAPSLVFANRVTLRGARGANPETDAAIMHTSISARVGAMIQSAARGTASMKVVKLLLSVAFRHASRVTYHDDIFPVSKCVRGDGGG
jgi:hypothetical protein